MKTRSSKLIPFLSVLSLAVWAVAPRAVAQTPAGLAIQTYAGLTITGAVGTVYSIEYVTDLAQTNNDGAWRCLEYLQLPASPYLWADKSAPATGQRFYRALVFPAPTNMVFIPPGVFRMGSPATEQDHNDWEGPLTEVIISRGFWMGKYEVTQGDYLAVTGNNPSYFNGDRTGSLLWFINEDFGTDLNRPVEWVSWVDATNYCATLTGLERAAGRIPTNCVYRLPTEAEWEYACRAWISTRFSFGFDPGYIKLTDYAWYVDNADAVVHPVGQKVPNPWGLYDMPGNVLEWCQNGYSDNHPGGMVVDPQGSATGTDRVVRGGHFFSAPENCRAAFRSHLMLYDHNVIVGFRAVLASGQP
jgi:formylglycine-generating enzyme required for sulfatase activity